MCVLVFPLQLGDVRGAQLPWSHVHCGERQLLWPQRVAGPEPQHPVHPQDRQLLLSPRHPEPPRQQRLRKQHPRHP